MNKEEFIKLYHESDGLARWIYFLHRRTTTGRCMMCKTKISCEPHPLNNDFLFHMKSTHGVDQGAIFALLLDA